MTPYRPEVVPDARYSLKEAAALLGVHPNTMRNYTKRHIVRVVYGKADGRPRYTGAELLRLWIETI